MAFDGIVTKSVVFELNSTLLNGKINKIYQPNKNELLLGIYANKKNLALLVSIDASSCRMHLTTSSKPNPLNAPNFCMLLRKHLLGMKIKSISSLGLERIITIELEGFDELNDFITKKLIIELMGKHSNVILVNESNTVIDSLRHIDNNNSNRIIAPVHPYLFPTPSKKDFLRLTSFEEFLCIIKEKMKTDSLDNSISNTFTGISKFLIQALCQQSSIDLHVPTQSQIKELYDRLKKITTAIESPYLTLISYQSDYIPFLQDKETPLSVNFFLDDFYSQKETREEFITYRNSILKLILNELKKYTKRLSNIQLKLQECEQMDQYRLYGELLTSYLYRFHQEKLSCVTLENYYDNNTPITIPLDKTLTISNNAKKYFKKYTKLKNAFSIVSQQKKDTAKEITYLESIVYELEKAKTLSDVDAIYQEISETVIFKEKLSSQKGHSKKTKNIKKKVNVITQPLCFQIDGFTVYVGKNNTQNDYLTFKLAHHNDIWFHTKDIHGSHVILKTDGKEIESTIINQCASLAAFYSKAAQSSNVPVDYTFVRYVKKPSGAKPGMVIYTNQTTVNVNPYSKKESLLK